MKKTLLTAAVIVACAGALAQGTVNVSSTPSSIGSTQLVTDADGVTPLAGADYFAQMYMGPDADSLAPQGKAVNFLSGGGAGFFRDTDTVVVDNVAAGAEGIAQVRAWEASGGASFEAALAAGALVGTSANFLQATGGAGAPPTLPANMVNFTAFSLVPEPSTAALGILGAIALMLRRRK